MFTNSRVTVVSLGLLSAVSFPITFSLSQAFADTQPHSVPAGSHAAPVKHHSIASASIAHVGSFMQTTKAPKAHSAVKVSTLTSDSISSVSKKHLAEEKAAEFRNHTNTRLWCIAYNSHGGCTGSGVFHQGAEGAVVGALTGALGGARAGLGGAIIGAGLGALGGSVGNIIYHSKPAMNAIDHAANTVGGGIVRDLLGPFNNDYVIPSRGVVQSVHQGISSSKSQVNSGTVVQQNVPTKVTPKVSLLG